MILIEVSSCVHQGKSNDGAGPDIIRDTSDETGETGHAEALRATVAEHKQHLANIQVF